MGWRKGEDRDGVKESERVLCRRFGERGGVLKGVRYYGMAEEGRQRERKGVEECYGGGLAR